MDYAEKLDELTKEFKQLLAEQRTSNEKARRAEEKVFYEEEVAKVRQEAKEQVEEVGKMVVKEITQHVANIAEEIKRQGKEEATRRAKERSEEMEKSKKEWNQREEEILKRVENATKEAQEAIFAAALAGKVEAEQQSANLMKKAEEMIRQAMEKAMVRVERRKGDPRSQREYTYVRNSDSDADVEIVQNLVQVPIAGPLNRGIDQTTFAKRLHSRDMDQSVEPKVKF